MHSLLTPSHRCTIRERRGRAVAAALALVLATAAGAPAAPAPSDAPRDTVLRGEVVEAPCFVIGGRRGDGHRQCALMGARSGESLGVLDDQTKLLFVVVQDLTAEPQPNPLLPYVAQRVEARGTVVERGGINGIVIRQVRSLSPPPRR
jgi:hypothetical protein